MAKEKYVVAYSPSESDFKHMRYCHKKGLIVLGVSGIYERPTTFHLTRTDYSTTPITLHYFLIDFKKPPTPSNRQEFTEKECYVKMFQIYKEFYMRDNNIKEEVIAETIKTEAEIKEKPKSEKVVKKKKEQKDWINYPFKEIDLLELIEICEQENNPISPEQKP